MVLLRLGTVGAVGPVSYRPNFTFSGGLTTLEPCSAILPWRGLPAVGMAAVWSVKVMDPAWMVIGGAGAVTRDYADLGWDGRSAEEVSTEASIQRAA